MNLLSDVLTYIRRIIKSPSNSVISDALLIDYVNRFWIMDVDARMQVFDLKTKYSFQTTPGVDQYNMPLYDPQTEPGSQTINMYPVYQGFLGPAYINGVRVPLHTQKSQFYNWFPNIVQNLQVVGVGDGTSGPYNLQIPLLGPSSLPQNPPFNAILRGHVDITGIIATGNNVDPPLVSSFNTNIPTTSVNSAVYITSIAENGTNVVVADSGQFLLSNYTGTTNYGLLMSPGNAPLGNTALSGNYVNAFAITNITQAAQAVVTATTNFQPGQTVDISGVGGMTEINDRTFTVVSVTATTVTLDVNSLGFTAFTAGGTITSIQNVINYFTGEISNLFFPVAIPEGNNINVQCYFFQGGLPRAILYYNNVLTLRAPPAQQYLVELDAYLSPAAFLSTEAAIPFGYMSEYLARGAARKILSDTGDIEQFQFYEPLFREQELLVWKRSQRQFTATRTETIYSNGGFPGYQGTNFQSSGF
jgi:hypothetical protein